MTAIVQRWRNGRDSYRPAGEVIRTADYSVDPVDESTARAFIVAHHYSKSYPAARFRYGLFRHSQLVGVAVLSQPCNNRVLTNTFPSLPMTDAVELGRFVLLDEVPANGETWMIGRVFAALRREQIAGVVSFADPQPRRAGDGRIIFPGHVGTIYAASNGAYLGRGTARTLRLLPDGTVLSDRALAKVRSGERGWRYATNILVAHGATQPTYLASGAFDRDEMAAWLPGALASVTRPLRHAGNHRFAWGLTRAVSRSLVRGAYPKLTDDEGER